MYLVSVLFNFTVFYYVPGFFSRLELYFVSHYVLGFFNPSQLCTYFIVLLLLCDLPFIYINFSDI